MVIIVEIIDGAHDLSYQYFNHLKMIRKSMYPKRPTINIICGRN
jgi:hypothetical protein